jgi:hypothetical protein
MDYQPQINKLSATIRRLEQRICCIGTGGSGSGSDPTASIGLTTINGSATTFMRSDAAPALSQSIIPTWTGLHTFNGRVNIGTTGSGALNVGSGISAITSSGNDQGITITSATLTFNRMYFENLGSPVGQRVFAFDNTNGVFSLGSYTDIATGTVISSIININHTTGIIGTVSDLNVGGNITAATSLTFGQSTASVVTIANRIGNVAALSLSILGQNAQQSGATAMPGGDVIIAGGSNYTSGSPVLSGRVFIHSGSKTNTAKAAPILLQFDGTNPRGNIGIFGDASINANDGTGVGVIYVANATTAPTTNPVGGGILYSASDSSLHWRNASGVDTDITTSKILTVTATLAFPNTNTGTSSDLPVTVTGAATGDVVIVTAPALSNSVGTCYTAWISGANTVQVRFNNYSSVGALTPLSGDFKIKVFKD